MTVKMIDNLSANASRDEVWRKMGPRMLANLNALCDHARRVESYVYFAQPVLQREKGDAMDALLKQMANFFRSPLRAESL